MMKIFKRFFKPKDELIGTWETTNEGGFQIVMGSKLVLNKNGLGKYTSWGGDDENDYTNEKSRTIFWKRINKSRIGIKFSDASNFDEINYVIKTYKGAYGILYDELFNPEQALGKTTINGFWVIPSELYRMKDKY